MSFPVKEDKIGITDVTAGPDVQKGGRDDMFGPVPDNAGRAPGSLVPGGAGSDAVKGGRSDGIKGISGGLNSVDVVTDPGITPREMSKVEKLGGGSDKVGLSGADRPSGSEESEI